MLTRSPPRLLRGSADDVDLLAIAFPAYRLATVFSDNNGYRNTAWTLTVHPGIRHQTALVLSITHNVQSSEFVLFGLVFVCLFFWVCLFLFCLFVWAFFFLVCFFICLFQGVSFLFVLFLFCFGGGFVCQFGGFVVAVVVVVVLLLLFCLFLFSFVFKSVSFLFLFFFSVSQHPSNMQSVPQRRISVDHWTCCHNETEVSDEMSYLTGAQQTYIRQFSRSTDVTRQRQAPGSVAFREGPANFGAKRGVTASMSAFLACHQCKLRGFESRLGLEYSGFSMWHFLTLVARGFLRVLRFPPLLHRFNGSANEIKLN